MHPHENFVSFESSKNHRPEIIFLISFFKKRLDLFVNKFVVVYL